MNLKTHSGDLGFDTFLPDEFVEDPLDPFCRWSRPFDDALLVETYPVHHNDHSSVIHDPDHSRKDPLQPLAKALEIKGFLKAGDLKYRATVDEQLVNLAGLFSVRVRQTDAQILRVNPRQCPNKGLAVVGTTLTCFWSRLDSSSMNLRPAVEDIFDYRRAGKCLPLYHLWSNRPRCAFASARMVRASRESWAV